MWPSAMPTLGVDVRGKISPEELAESGRALARFTDLGLGQRVRALLGDEAPDGPVPDELIRATVQVLASWDWAQRPDLVGHVASNRRPHLVADLAGRLADIGQLSNLGAVPHRGPTSSTRSNSALRLRDVWDSYRLPDDVTDRVAGRVVLLVDDTTDTGWTLTVVARLLRRAGAERVYPFVLGIAA